MEKYFIINNSDGDTCVDCVSKEELLKRINSGYYGEHQSFLDVMPNESDTNYWGDNILIIKGEIVSPKEQKIVTEYTIK